MKKIADNYYQLEERLSPSKDVTIDMVVERVDGKDLDTSVNLQGQFCIAGYLRKEFSEKLGKLINEYRI